MILFKSFTPARLKPQIWNFIKANLAVRFHALLILFFPFNFDVNNCSAEHSEDSQWPIDTRSDAIHYLMTHISLTFFRWLQIIIFFIEHAVMGAAT